MLISYTPHPGASLGKAHSWKNMFSELEMFNESSKLLITELLFETNVAVLNNVHWRTIIVITAITGKSKQGHLNAIDAVLGRSEQVGFRLRQEKSGISGA